MGSSPSGLVGRFSSEIERLISAIVQYVGRLGERGQGKGSRARECAGRLGERGQGKGSEIGELVIEASSFRKSCRKSYDRNDIRRI